MIKDACDRLLSRLKTGQERINELDQDPVGILHNEGTGAKPRGRTS